MVNGLVGSKNIRTFAISYLVVYTTKNRHNWLED